jgi:zinc-ribbon domain
MARYCPNCGTEVDETAAFCPTCGQPIDQAAEAEIPPAPAWPDPARPPEPGPEPEPAAAESERPAYRADEPDRDDAAWVEEPTRVETPPPPPPAQRASAPEAAGHREPARQVNLPVTWPVTLSGWLIGIGTVLAAIGVVIAMFRIVNAIDLLLLLLLVGVALTVFFSGSLPHIPFLRLATLAVVLIGFGMALDRIGFGAAGIGELLLFLGTAAAAIGCVLLEIGRDQPLGGPGS